MKKIVIALMVAAAATPATAQEAQNVQAVETAASNEAAVVVDREVRLETTTIDPTTIVDEAGDMKEIDRPFVFEPVRNSSREVVVIEAPAIVPMSTPEADEDAAKAYVPQSSPLPGLRDVEPK